MCKSDIGMVGLAVMGENLALNLEGKGFYVSLYNRESEWVERFINGRGKGKNFIGCATFQDLVDSLKRPRKIWMMIKAGSPVDEVIEALLPLLDDGDILIDGGNSYYGDTIRRTAQVEAAGKYFIGTGVSGGEEGALHGPALMPGGSPAAWPSVKDLFEKMAARTDSGDACCGWVGSGGAGHFVKMVHNGIEYGDMQLISEAYHFMKELLQLSNQQMAEIFRQWNGQDLRSYLIEITSDILAYRDESNNYVLDSILDAAGQKGTGKWAVIEASHLGQPLTLIAEAVFARCLSSMKDERVAASSKLPANPTTAEPPVPVEDLSLALYAAKLVSYAQGFQLMRAASLEYGWNIDYAAVAGMWRGGCIIRSAFLGQIYQSFSAEPDLSNLLVAPYFAEKILAALPSWRRVVAQAVQSGIPVPAMSSALAYYDGYRRDWLPANLIQAQRDYFGAHTYERTDQLRGKFFHTNWTGTGGDTTSSAYQR